MGAGVSVGCSVVAGGVSGAGGGGDGRAEGDGICSVGWGVAAMLGCGASGGWGDCIGVVVLAGVGLAGGTMTSRGADTHNDLSMVKDIAGAQLRPLFHMMRLTRVMLKVCRILVQVSPSRTTYRVHEV